MITPPYSLFQLIKTRMPCNTAPFIDVHSTGLNCRDLSYNDLDGEIPKEISALTRLTKLCVFFICGHLSRFFHPKKIGRPKVQHLLSTTDHACLYRNLAGNALTSQIPSEISALRRLTVLCAFFTRVHLPCTLFQLIKTRTLTS